MEKFINEQEINNALTNAKKNIDEVISNALLLKGLSLDDVATLLTVDTKEDLDKLFEGARKVKDELYGNRVVLFAPLYISNHCTNSCRYCGFQVKNDIPRRRLTKNELIEELKALEEIGHKRIALEVGEHHKHADIDYVCDSIKTIYDNSDIRRINVNIAATSVDDYKKLKQCDIGTYLLFQETYHEESYKYHHLAGAKSNYLRQLNALHNAMEAGIDDVGGGILIGLYDYKFDVLSMIKHNMVLEEKYKVGFHTVSVPRLKSAIGQVDEYPYEIDDFTFKKIVAILRLALPKVGIILSTRESKEMREVLINHGVSQISASSKTDVGGYSDEKEVKQFELSDERPLLDVIKGILKEGLVPSYCTACYRNSRTGSKFMEMVEQGKIKHFCHANSILTLCEYIEEKQDAELSDIGYKVVYKEIENITDLKIKEVVAKNVELIKKGERDLYI